MKCKFLTAWYVCKGEATKNGFCEYHNNIKCSNKGCNNPAIGECLEASSLCCGAPYCEKCGSHLDCFYKRGHL